MRCEGVLICDHYRLRSRETYISPEIDTEGLIVDFQGDR